jgi:phosphatidylglycerophosphatase (EC 3.1.3.27)
MAESEKPRTYRPPARLILGDPLHLLAFGGGAGLAPVAPGTFGTLVGSLLWWPLMLLPWPAYLLALAIAALAGIWICGRSARRLGVHDHPGIVFDEIVAVWLTALPLLPAFGLADGHRVGGWVAAFLLFRFFDIVKPPPIRWLDRHVGGGLGIMLDDLVAALPAGALLALGLWLLQ